MVERERTVIFCFSVNIQSVVPVGQDHLILVQSQVHIYSKYGNVCYDLNISVYFLCFMAL